MNHSEVSALLGDYVEGDLELAERARLDEHLPECTSCAEQLRELRETVALLRRLPEPTPRPGLAAAVMARIGAGEGRPPLAARAFRRLGDPPIAALLAAGVAGFAFFAGLDGTPPDAGAPHAAPAVTAVAPPAGVGSAFAGTASGSPLMDLDLALQMLRRDPVAVLNQLEAVSERERERSYQLLVERARLRGESEQEYLRSLQAAQHRLAASLAAHFEPRALPREPRALEVDLTSAQRPSR